MKANTHREALEQIARLSETADGSLVDVRAMLGDIAKHALSEHCTTGDNKPRIVINVEGGLVQAVLSDVPCELVKIDYDTEGADLEDLKQLDQGDGSEIPAWVDIGSTDCDAVEVARVFAAADKAVNT